MLRDVNEDVRCASDSNVDITQKCVFKQMIKIVFFDEVHLNLIKNNMHKTTCLLEDQCMTVM